jgi:hypothetical protein
MSFGDESTQSGYGEEMKFSCLVIRSRCSAHSFCPDSLEKSTASTITYKATASSWPLNILRTFQGCTPAKPEYYAFHSRQSNAVGGHLNRCKAYMRVNDNHLGTGG